MRRALRAAPLVLAACASATPGRPSPAAPAPGVVAAEPRLDGGFGRWRRGHALPSYVKAHPLDGASLPVLPEMPPPDGKDKERRRALDAVKRDSTSASARYGATVHLDGYLTGTLRIGYADSSLESRGAWRECGPGLPPYLAAEQAAEWKGVKGEGKKLTLVFGRGVFVPGECVLYETRTESVALTPLANGLFFAAQTPCQSCGSGGVRLLVLAPRHTQVFTEGDAGSQHWSRASLHTLSLARGSAASFVARVPRNLWDEWVAIGGRSARMGVDSDWMAGLDAVFAIGDEAPRLVASSAAAPARVDFIPLRGRF